jgi:isopenicillin-N N-acyltransferase-like protein
MHPAVLLDLPRLTIAGDPEALGRAYGESLRAPIRAFVAQRLRAARDYLRERGRDESALVALGNDCLARLQGWDAEGWREHRATAAGAGIDPAELYAAANMTDLRDIIALPGPAAEREGCTAVLVPAARSADRAVMAGQTWDLNPGDLEFVVAVERRPAAGPRTWSVTCVGCPTLVGMNEEGVAVGTTNIKVRGAHPGIPYLSLLHRAVRAPSADAALELIAAAPRAAAHTYWSADARGAADVECTADHAVRRDADHPLCRTNHCLDAGHQADEGEPPSASSRARIARARAALAADSIAEADLVRLFADRSDGIDSISRYAEDLQGTSTNACIIAHPAARQLRACRGAADRGAWITLGFAP